MTFKRKGLGREGERLAASFLKKKGYKILEINARIGRLGEIDIVAKKENKIIFVEVKTRSGRDFGTPEESINFFKQKKLVDLAHAYLNIKKWQYLEFAIDGVFIDAREGQYEIRHLENIIVL